MAESSDRKKFVIRKDGVPSPTREKACEIFFSEFLLAALEKGFHVICIGAFLDENGKAHSKLGQNFQNLKLSSILLDSARKEMEKFGGAVNTRTAGGLAN